MQGMTSIKPEVPVVASCGDLKLRWHARELRGAGTLSETAARLGVNRDELSRIERGETVQIRFETIAKLLYGYKCDVSDLFEVLVDAPADSAPPWAGALAAIQSGRVRAGLPRRPDPDMIEDNVVPADVPGYADELVAAYAEDGDDRDADRVRRGAFRPSVRAVAGSK